MPFQQYGYEDAFDILLGIYEKHRRKYRGSPYSMQMCSMWSMDDPPDVLESTKPILDIEKAFDIEIDEDVAVKLFDMNLDKATNMIIKMQKRHME